MNNTMRYLQNVNTYTIKMLSYSIYTLIASYSCFLMIFKTNPIFMKYTLTAVVTAIAIFFIGFISAKLWYMKLVDNSIQFVWNDDEESIPKDGSAILLEFTDENTVYIGPLENETDSSEYQFTVTEDSISITDFDRHVGTVKIEGKLKELINKDNL